MDGYADGFPDIDDSFHDNLDDAFWVRDFGLDMASSSDAMQPTHETADSTPTIQDQFDVMASITESSDLLAMDWGSTDYLSTPATQTTLTVAPYEVEKSSTHNSSHAKELEDFLSYDAGDYNPGVYSSSSNWAPGSYTQAQAPAPGPVCNTTVQVALSEQPESSRGFEQQLCFGSDGFSAPVTPSLIVDQSE